MSSAKMTNLPTDSAAADMVTTVSTDVATTVSTDVATTAALCGAVSSTNGAEDTFVSSICPNMHGDVIVREEKVVFKTYLTGKQDPHPIFLEHRVYQGSSGAVYPYGVTDTLEDKFIMQEYKALILENEFLKVMILPELGGRVQRAYDKVNHRDFVYFNHVVKPALVGLLGPWISGGIEFNWPQHHRPTTYMNVDYTIKLNDDHSVTAIVGEREPMHGLTVSTSFTLYYDRALLEIKSKIFNGNDTPRSFLWWSNPAVKGGDGHQSIFPPDVTAVFDHGKRAVIDFPIAHGEYYKVKYDSVDISRYRNLPVPTSYMAWRSNFDFVGAYDHNEEGGLLHIADHHISPGKKQWSWGYGDFGQSWDRNLTDSDGPYIELMTGVYTDNQPDFTWLEAGEEKEFVQNFLPYSKLGRVHNATTQAAIKLERLNVHNEPAIYEEHAPQLQLGVYAIAPLNGSLELISIPDQPSAGAANNLAGSAVSTSAPQQIFSTPVTLTPGHAATFAVSLSTAQAQESLTLILNDSEGREIVRYCEHIPEEVPLPEVAPTPALPQDIKSTDEAFFIGQHLEQYHHATRHYADYYQRGLEIDPLDYRCNVALSQFEFNRAQLTSALNYAEQSLKRAHMLNRNSADGQGSLLKAHCLELLGRYDEAYDEYFRATWSYNGRTQGFIGLATIACQRQQYRQAYDLITQGLQTQSNNARALALQIYATAHIPEQESLVPNLIKQAQELYPLNPVFAYLKVWLAPQLKHVAELALHPQDQETHGSKFYFTDDANQLLDDVAQANNQLEQVLTQREINYINIVEFLHQLQRDDLALAFMAQYEPYGAIANLMYAALLKGAGAEQFKVEHYLAKAQDEFAHFVRFPNLVCERLLLGTLNESAFALHLCACFDYSHRLYESAAKLWQQALELEPNYSEALRGLGIYTFNKLHDRKAARDYYDRALQSSPSDERMLFEHDLLLKLSGASAAERLSILEAHHTESCVRDDLKCELVTLYNQLGQYHKAHELLTKLNFHVWEGGEGRVMEQYILNALYRAQEQAHEQQYIAALQTVLEALTIPRHLGEGKLVVQTDNDLYFFAACYAKLAGLKEQAEEYLAKAKVGDSSISEQVYYNDVPVDYVFYQALAHAQANDPAEQAQAQQIFTKMQDWSYQAYDQQVTEDFFAVSLPDLVVLDRDLQQNRQENCLLMRALAAIGLGNKNLAKQHLHELATLAPANFKVNLYETLLNTLIEVAQTH